MGACGSRQWLIDRQATAGALGTALTSLVGVRQWLIDRQATAGISAGRPRIAEAAAARAAEQHLQDAADRRAAREREIRQVAAEHKESRKPLPAGAAKTMFSLRRAGRRDLATGKPTKK